MLVPSAGRGKNRPSDIPPPTIFTPISRYIITKFANERNIVLDLSVEEAEVEEGGRNKMESRRRRKSEEGRGSYRQFMRPLPLGNRVSLKRKVDSFVGCVINCSTTSRQITRLGCITI